MGSDKKKCREEGPESKHLKLQMRKAERKTGVLYLAGGPHTDTFIYLYRASGGSQVDGNVSPHAQLSSSCIIERTMGATRE